jgi:hypothetical protein
MYDRQDREKIVQREMWSEDNIKLSVMQDHSPYTSAEHSFT